MTGRSPEYMIVLFAICAARAHHQGDGLWPAEAAPLRQAHLIKKYVRIFRAYLSRQFLLENGE